MTTASTWPLAARLASDNLYTKYVADTLKGALNDFWTELKDLFASASTSDLLVTSGGSFNPLQNWLSIIAALESTIPAVQPKLAANSELQFDQAVGAIYRFCWLCNVMIGASLGTLGLQALGIYNSNFG